MTSALSLHPLRDAKLRAAAMRICIINPNFYRSSGVTVAIRRIDEAVAPYGIQNHFIDCQYGSEAEDLGWIPPERLAHLPLMSLDPRSLVGGLRRLRELLDRWGIELIHVHHRRLLILLTLARWMHGRPILFSGNLTTPFSLAFWLFGPRRAIAVTESVRDNLFATTRTRDVTVLGNPTPFPAACPPVDVASVRQRAVCVARLVPVKGHETLIEAWAMLRDRGLERELVLVGEGPLLADLQARCRALRIEHLIDFRGFRADVQAEYARALFAILVSSVEGQGIVTIEAAACGRASLLTDVDGSRDCLPPDRSLPNGLPFGDARALADALQAWFEAPDAVAAEGRRFFDFHRGLNSSQVLGARYVDAYRRSIEGRPLEAEKATAS